jgi:TBCC domain-containing protein 1
MIALSSISLISTRLHAGWNNDNTHCTAYLIRHLRKALLLTAISHNPDAFRACMHLAAIPSPSGSRNSGVGKSAGAAGRRTNAPANHQYSAEELQRQHGNVGLNVLLTMEDLERLDFLFQPPAGGGIDEPPLRIGDFLLRCIYNSHQVPPMATIPLGQVERELRRQLNLELSMSGRDDKSDVEVDEVESTASTLARLNLMSKKDAQVASERAQQPDNHYQKELSYTHLRGTTILLKPNPQEASSGASMASGEPNVVTNRLHDLAISDCSDAHFYLLQPFEHATIAACTGCTIVVGAVAGLLHVVDCEKTTITSAARRILVSNSCDVQLCIFSPSPPLLVGDNRSCQFAPYNTYYDGLREDLLATGLAAAVVPESQSPFHGGRDSDAAWPPLQCASNKWKQPVELSKLEVPQVPGSPAGSPGGSNPISPLPGADDKANPDATMQAPILVPASEFNILFVPLESDSFRQRRQETEENEGTEALSGPVESQYCRLLSEVLQLSPFRLPVEYERRILMKAERMRNIQQAVQKNLTPEQQSRFEEELNRGFRDWLVTSGNLRQVLDLVHMERRENV